MKPFTLKQFFITLKECALITLGLSMYVVAWDVFLVPQNLIGGGVSGVASIIQYATHGAIKMGYTYFSINIILLTASIFILGGNFGWKTLYAVIITSIGLNVVQDVIPASIPQAFAVENGKLMSVIMGGLVAGVGIGITMSQNGSTGGTDIIALMINKYYNISPGKLLLFMDVFIILSSLLVPSYLPTGELVPMVDKVTTVVYAFILVTISSATLDMYLSGMKQSVQMIILSKKYDKIADGINNELNRGVTVLDGQGWYTKAPAKVLLVITRKTDLNIFLKFIKNIDPDAFLSVSSVNGVYGQGFDVIKTGAKILKKKTEDVDNQGPQK